MVAFYSVTGMKPFEAHMRKHKRTTCPHCQITLSPISLKRHLQSCKANEEEVDVPQYLCDQCDYKTDRSGNLERHKKKHSKSKLYCEECGHQCTSEKKLEKHKEKAHKPQKVSI